MSVKQISISLDNVPGKFLEVSEHLGVEGINIRAISVADTSDVSTVRFVADDPEKCTNVLRSHGYSVKETDVIAVEVPDHPGGLQAVLKPLKYQRPLFLSLSGQGGEWAAHSHHWCGQD
jgi:hypothetical protein